MEVTDEPGGGNAGSMGVEMEIDNDGSAGTIGDSASTPTPTAVGHQESRMYYPPGGLAPMATSDDRGTYTNVGEISAGLRLMPTVILRSIPTVPCCLAARQATRQPRPILRPSTKSHGRQASPFPTTTWCHNMVSVALPRCWVPGTSTMGERSTTTTPCLMIRIVSA